MVDCILYFRQQIVFVNIVIQNTDIYKLKQHKNKYVTADTVKKKQGILQSFNHKMPYLIDTEN